MKSTLRFEALEERDVPSAGSTLTVVDSEPSYTLSINSTGRVAVMQLTDGNEWLAFRDGAQTTAQNQEIAKRLYKSFPDQFDMIFAVNNLPDITTGLFGYNVTVQNQTTGIGKPVMDDTALWGSAGKLQNFIFLASEQEMYTRTTSLHEILHRASAFLPQLNSAAYAGHWGFSSVGGVMGGWEPGTLRQIGPNTYDADGPAGTTDWYENTFSFLGPPIVPYSQLELYLMGLIDATQVDPVQFATNPAWLAPLNSFGASALGQFTADSIQTLTINNIIAQEGIRFPTPATSQKDFRTISVILTPTPLTQGELDQFDTNVELFGRAGSDGNPQILNYWEATGGRSSLKMDGLNQFLPYNSHYLGVGTTGAAKGLVVGSSGKYDQLVFPNIAQYFGVGPDQSIRTAVGDVDGDGIPDFAVATGPGTTTKFAVLSGDQSRFIMPPIAPFAGSADFTGGAFISVGDLDGDGRSDVVLSPDNGGGPRVSIYSFKPNVGTYRIADFFGIADASFRGGARTAVGDMNHDGRPDLAVAAGQGGGPRVSIYNGASLFSTRGKLVADFFAFPGADAINLRNGVYLAIGDLNGDSYGDIVFGAGNGGSPRVLALNGKTLLSSGSFIAGGSPIADFHAGSTSARGGVRVAVKNVDNDTRMDIVTGSGVGLPGSVSVYKGSALRGRAQPPVFQTIGVSTGLDAVNDGVFVG